MAEQHSGLEATSDIPPTSAVEMGDLRTAGADTAGLWQSYASGSRSTTQSRAGSQPDSSIPQVVDHPQVPTIHELDGNSNTRDTSPAPLPEHVERPTGRTARQNSEAIGPPTELPTPMLQVPLTGSPILQFTLLLASTGTRHPFQLNEKYLAKRNVKAAGSDGLFDPSTISVYALKELILKDWRDDWDSRPSSPSAIRLISFGQLLSDNVSLKDCKLLMDGTANVLHITVKPQDVMEDEEAGKGVKSSIIRGRDGHDSSPGCRCVIL